jgi:hypothetical protein
MESEQFLDTFMLRIELTDAILLDLLNYSYSGQHSHTYLDALDEAVKSRFGSAYSYRQICETYTITKTETAHSSHQMYLIVLFDKLREQTYVS